MEWLATKPEFNNNINRVDNRNALDKIINSRFSEIELDTLADALQKNILLLDD